MKGLTVDEHVVINDDTTVDVKSEVNSTITIIEDDKGTICSIRTISGSFHTRSTNTIQANIHRPLPNSTIIPSTTSVEKSSLSHNIILKQSLKGQDTEN